MLYRRQRARKRLRLIMAMCRGVIRYCSATEFERDSKLKPSTLDMYLCEMF